MGRLAEASLDAAGAGEGLLAEAVASCEADTLAEALDDVCTSEAAFAVSLGAVSPLVLSPFWPACRAAPVGLPSGASTPCCESAHVVSASVANRAAHATAAALALPDFRVVRCPPCLMA